MSQINNLINRLCPDGVSYPKLSEIAHTVSGLTGKNKADFTEGNARYVSYRNIYTNLTVDQNAPDFVRVGPGEKQNRLQYGDVLFTGSSETADEVGLSSVVDVEPAEPLYLNSFCFALRLNEPELLLPEFSKHLFRSPSVRAAIQKSANGVTRINLSKQRFLNITVPTPPAEVQREIVRILDHFVMLDEDLEAELEARKQQQLAFTRTLPGAPRTRVLASHTAESVRLGEVATQYVEPLRVQPAESYTNLGVKWFGEGAFARPAKLGSAIKGSKLYRVKPGQFIYNRMFVVEGSFAIITPELGDGVVSNEFPVYELDSSRVLPEWLLLYFKDEYTLKRIEAEVTGVERGSTKSRRRWKEDQFEAFRVELPPVPVQRELLRVLATVAGLQSGLRGERDGRRTQYQYYSERLLTFVERVA